MKFSSDPYSTNYMLVSSLFSNDINITIKDIIIIINRDSMFLYVNFGMYILVYTGKLAVCRYKHFLKRIQKYFICIMINKELYIQ